MTPDQCRAAREHRNWTRDELRKAADVPLWFVAAFEDGRETPSFLVCWEVAMQAALGDTGADEFPRELGRDPPFDSEEQVNACVIMNSPRHRLSKFFIRKRAAQKSSPCQIFESEKRLAIFHQHAAPPPFAPSPQVGATGSGALVRRSLSQRTISTNGLLGYLDRVD